MRRLIRWLFDIPTSVTSFGRRLDAMEDDLLDLKVRLENQRGQLLTLSRRISRVQVDVQQSIDDDSDSDEGDDERDEIDELIARRRASGQ